MSKPFRSARLLFAVFAALALSSGAALAGGSTASAKPAASEIPGAGRISVEGYSLGEELQGCPAGTDVIKAKDGSATTCLWQGDHQYLVAGAPAEVFGLRIENGRVTDVFAKGVETDLAVAAATKAYGAPEGDGNWVKNGDFLSISYGILLLHAVDTPKPTALAPFLAKAASACLRDVKAGHVYAKTDACVDAERILSMYQAVDDSAPFLGTGHMPSHVKVAIHAIRELSDAAELSYSRGKAGGA